jgi:hypothetical protein
MKKGNKAKGPLIITVALIFATPICLAESALAQTTSSLQGSSFQRPQSAVTSSRYEQSLWWQSQSGLPLQSQNQPKNYLGSRLLASSLPSLEDIYSLEFTLSEIKNQLNTLKTKKVSATTISNIQTQISDVETAITLAKQARTAYQRAQATLSTLLSDLAAQKATNSDLFNKKTVAQADLDAKKLTLEQVKAVKEQSLIALASAQLTRQTAEQELLTSDASLTEQKQIRDEAQAILTERQVAYSTATAHLNTASNQLQTANQDVDQAQHDYDNNLIPDPSYAPPTYQQERTRQVPQTTTQLTGGLTTNVYDRQGYNEAPPMPYQGETPIHTTTVPNVNYNWNSSQILNSGREEDVIVEFTGYISPTTSGYYRFYTPADDGTKLYINNQLLIDDWYDKGGGGSVSAPIYLEANTPVPVTLYYYENGGGAAVSFYYYTPTEGYQIVPAAWLGTQTQTTTTYITETYYTTEPVISEQTINVNITEGGEATFNAPKGSTFTSSNLRYESINNPTCGTNIYPQVNGLSSVTLQADNAVYGDPCGGQVKRITGTLTYVGPPPAPLIKNPTLLAILNNKKQAQVQAQENYDAKLSTKNVAEELKTSAESELSTRNQELSQATTFNEAAKAAVVTATTQEQEAEAEAIEASSNFESASSNVVAAEQTFQAAETLHEESTIKLTRTEAQATEAKATETSSLNVAAQTYTEASQKASATSNEIKAIPEEGSQELPAELTADSLLTTDLTNVDPTEMTPEQAEQLKEAALEVFLTAEEGSPEYEQALDALYLAAEQDDIVLDPSLAAIPGLAAATELVNFFGNAGSDMSPKTREESEKVVVTAVVAAGAAIQSAAAAAATASGGTTRR